MKIGIVGAGAMGSLFGAMLHEGGIEVFLVDINKEHVDAINRNGLTIEEGAQSRVLRIKATTDPEGLGPVDLAIIFVKSYATGAASRTAASLIGERGHVLTVQNGMGNAEVIAEHISAERILAGTTSQGATFTGPGRIFHAGRGPTTIGPWTETAPGLAMAEQVAAAFTSCGIETQSVKDIRPVLWKKLLINVGINAITALTGIKNRELLDLDVTRELSKTAVEEAMEVAKSIGIALPQDMVQTVFQVAEATGENRSSMGQDVDSRRPTEIQAINGFVMREGQRLGVKTPVNQTLTALIQTLEHHYLAKK